jgi:hypothetical protein
VYDNYGMFYGRWDVPLARVANSTANDAASEARGAKREIALLEQRLERLALMTEALWTLLRDKLGASDEELMAVAREVDLSDGRLDGRVHRTSVQCPECGRMVSERHVKCLYCGTEIPRAPFTGT